MSCRPTRAVACAALPVLLAACQGLGAQPAQSAQPARLRNADAACLRAVGEAAAQLAGQPVTLGPQPFANGAVLLLESGNARDAEGLPLDGRKTGRPLALTLERTAAGACELRHEAAGRSLPLPASCSCEAVAARP